MWQYGVSCLVDNTAMDIAKSILLRDKNISLHAHESFAKQFLAAQRRMQSGVWLKTWEIIIKKILP